MALLASARLPERRARMAGNYAGRVGSWKVRRFEGWKVINLRTFEPSNFPTGESQGAQWSDRTGPHPRRLRQGALPWQRKSGVVQAVGGQDCNRRRPEQ